MCSTCIVFLFCYLNWLIVFFPSACSHVQSFAGEPTHSRNIVFRGKGFPSALLSEKPCGTAISCYAAWAFLCKKFARSKCFRPQSGIFRDAVSGECELWFIGFQSSISLLLFFFSFLQTCLLTFYCTFLGQTMQFRRCYET